MVVGEFKAICQRGHDLETFTDRAAFEAHMTEHGESKTYPGAPFSPVSRYDNRKIGAPGWRMGKIEPPKTPKAPPAPKDTVKLTEILATAGHDVVDWSTPDMVPPIELRPGDAFEWSGRVYDVLDVDATRGRHLAMRPLKSFAGHSGWLPFATLDSRAQTVRIVKRAAAAA